MPAGGKVNAVALDIRGLNAVVGALSGSDSVMVNQGGDNVVATVSDINAGASVPDPLLLGDGDAANPTYAFASDSGIGVFLQAATEQTFTGTQWRASNTNGPALQNEAPSANNPTVLYDNLRPGTGIGGSGDEMMLISDGQRVAEIGSAPRFRLDVPLRFFVANGPQINNVAASATVANLNPVQGDNTGVGRRIMSIGVLVANAINAMEFGGVGSVPQIGFYGTAAINQQTGVAVTDVAIHAALVNLGLITA